MADRKGKSIEDRAKEAEATGPRLPAPKQALRDSLIVRRRAQGWEVEAIASEADVSARTVHRVIAERASVGEALTDRDPIDVVKQIVVQCQKDAEDFEELDRVVRPRRRERTALRARYADFQRSKHRVRRARP